MSGSISGIIATSATTRIGPSGGNRQQTRFILVRDEKRKDRLVRLCYSHSFISQAPVVVVAFSHKSDTNRCGYMGILLMLVDRAMAFDHLTLADRAEGLGTCWIGLSDTLGTREFLKIPEGVPGTALTPLDYPKAIPSERASVCFRCSRW